MFSAYHMHLYTHIISLYGLCQIIPFGIIHDPLGYSLNPFTHFSARRIVCNSPAPHRLVDLHLASASGTALRSRTPSILPALVSAWSALVALVFSACVPPHAQANLLQVLCGRWACARTRAVIVKHHRDRVRTVSVHVDQGVEAAVGAGEASRSGVSYTSGRARCRSLWGNRSGCRGRWHSRERPGSPRSTRHESHPQETLKSLCDIIIEPTFSRMGSTLSSSGG